jgi:hypothetical protein
MVARRTGRARPQDVITWIINVGRAMTQRRHTGADRAADATAGLRLRSAPTRPSGMALARHRQTTCHQSESTASVLPRPSARLARPRREVLATARASAWPPRGPVPVRPDSGSVGCVIHCEEQQVTSVRSAYLLRRTQMRSRRRRSRLPARRRLLGKWLELWGPEDVRHSERRRDLADHLCRAATHAAAAKPSRA